MSSILVKNIWYNLMSKNMIDSEKIIKEILMFLVRLDFNISL